MRIILDFVQPFRQRLWCELHQRARHGAHVALLTPRQLIVRNGPIEGVLCWLDITPTDRK